jgi:hypothetical protein
MPESVTLIIEANPISHLVPRIVKIWSITLFHVSVDVFLVPVVSNSLLYYLAALTIEHTFVSHLLVPWMGVVIHLVTLCYFLTVRSHCSLSLCLVNLRDWLAIRSNLRGLVVALGLETWISTHTTTEASVHAHHISFHHLLDSTSKGTATFSVKKGIIIERVAHAETFKHLAGHLIHIIVLSLHHREHVLVTATKGLHLAATVRLHWSISVRH